MITEIESEVNKMITIKNASYYATQSKYIVFTIVDGEAWFFSAWDDFGKAMAQAREYGLNVVENELCDFEIW